MKKFMRIALVFALAGATLMYTGCTKDYSGDISDLNKKVSEQASALSALQTQVAAAQSSASEALSSAQNALKEAQAAAKAAEAANNDAEVAALTTKIATIEGNIAGLQAKVEALNGLEAKLNEVADQLKKDVNAKVDAALEEIQKELEKAIAQVEGNFSIKGLFPYSYTKAAYYWSKWNPGTTKAEKENFAKLSAAFPELAEIQKGDAVSYNTGVPFIVTPATVEFDETDSFALVDKYGRDFGWTLGAPFASPLNVKAGTAGVWYVDILGPAYGKNGKEIETTAAGPYALVVEKENGAVAQTSFEYEVIQHQISKDTPFGVEIARNYSGTPTDVELIYNSFNFKDDAVDIYDYIGVTNNNNPIYNDYFVIEPTNVVLTEKYGVSVDGSVITIANRPEVGESAAVIPFKITAVGMNGWTASNNFEVQVNPEVIAANAELADQTVTLGHKNNSYLVAVDYAVADFGFSALEWDTVFNELYPAPTGVTLLNANALKNDNTKYDDNAVLGIDGSISFLKSDKRTPATVSTDAKYIRFVVDSKKAIPGEYSVKLTDGVVFCAVGNVTVANPEACPIKLAEALCDADGVLQIVGASDGTNITYDLNAALVYKTDEATVVKFTDVDYKEAYDYDSNTTEVNWISNPLGTFKIGKQSPTNKQLYTARTFEVEFNWFTNALNKGKFEFVAEAVSPIYDEAGKGDNITFSTKNAKGETVINTTIYYAPDAAAKESATTGSLAGGITGGTYVAGNNKGAEFKIESHAAVPAKVFKWVTLDASKNFFDYSKPETAAPAAINHTNIQGGRNFVVGTDNKLVAVPLDKALALGYITQTQYIELTSDPDGYTYYLSESRWNDLFNVWKTYWNQTFEYNGQKTAVGTIHSNDATGDSYTVVEAKIAAMTEKINNLAKGTDADKREKAKYDYFVSLLGEVQFKTRLTGECCYSDKPSDAVPAYFAPKGEIAEMPYFTCANEGEYTNLVKFDHEGTTNHVTAVTAKANAAGKKTVTIPLTANVVDEWGMTSKKTVEITVKVK